MHFIKISFNFVCLSICYLTIITTTTVSGLQHAHAQRNKEYRTVRVFGLEALRPREFRNAATPNYLQNSNTTHCSKSEVKRLNSKMANLPLADDMQNVTVIERTNPIKTNTTIRASPKKKTTNKTINKTISLKQQNNSTRIQSTSTKNNNRNETKSETECKVRVINRYWYRNRNDIRNRLNRYWNRNNNNDDRIRNILRRRVQYEQEE